MPPGRRRAGCFTSLHVKSGGGRGHTRLMDGGAELTKVSLVRSAAHVGTVQVARDNFTRENRTSLRKVIVARELDSTNSKRLLFREDSTSNKG